MSIKTTFEKYQQERKEVRDKANKNARCFTVQSLIDYLSQYKGDLPVYFRGSSDYDPAHSAYVEVEKVRKTSYRPARIEVTVHHEWYVGGYED